ncbi:hypothetical protein ACNIQZ_25305, partial [Escherichia coli]
FFFFVFCFCCWVGWVGGVGLSPPQAVLVGLRFGVLWYWLPHPKKKTPTSLKLPEVQKKRGKAGCIKNPRKILMQKKPQPKKSKKTKPTP